MGGVFVFITTFFRAVFLLLTCALIAVLTMTGAAETNQFPFDPFAPYANIMPGQPQGDIEIRGFKCLSQPVVSFNYMPQCSMLLTVGAISEITVDISPYTDHVTRVAFILRENLTLGHLTRLWGKPQTNMVGGLAYFYWLHGHITAIAHIHNHHISYWLPINVVAFV